MAASVAAVIAYVLIFPVLTNLVLAPFQPPQEEAVGSAQTWLFAAVNLIGSAGLGLAIGLGQWWALRSECRHLGGWVPATVAGYSLIAIMPSLVGELGGGWLAGPLFLTGCGVILGILQWLALRGCVRQAAWWVAISTGGWALAVALIGLAEVTGLYVEPFDLLAVFLVPVAVGGAGMVWLLRRSPAAAAVSA
jgi:hypothetical protein